jgi:hypothetical protein
MGSGKPTLEVEREEPRTPEEIAINPRRYFPWGFGFQSAN